MFLGAISPVICLGFEKETSLDPNKLDWYASWVPVLPEDSPAELYTNDPAEIKKYHDAEDKARQDWVNRVRSEPDALPYLKELFHRFYALPESGAAGGAPAVLEAITLRAELTEADVADLTAEVDRILATPVGDGNAGDHHNFLLLYYGKYVTPRFPTAANLDRCVRTITRSRGINWLLAKVHLLSTLSKIGTEDTLPLAEEILAWLNKRAEGAEGDGPDGIYAQSATVAKKRVAAMKQRLADEAAGKSIPPTLSYANSLKAAQTPPATDTSATAPPAPSPVADARKPSPTTGETAGHQSATDTSRLLWVAAALLLIIPAWLLAAKRRSGPAV